MVLSSRSANPELLESKLSRFTVGNTRVVTDFDSTLTADNGHSSWSLFGQGGLLPAEAVERRRVLKETYYPHEIDATLSVEKRAEYMNEWWEKALDVLREYGLHRDSLLALAARDMAIREGFDGLLREAHGLSIPVLVLSAGITQSIESVLKAHDSLKPNVAIASNELTFDENGVCTGFAGRVIHTVNKDEWDADDAVRAHFEERKNVLLFGDSLDDIRMVKPEKRGDTVAVGFCTKSRKHQLGLFRETFDIVVEEDLTDAGVCAALVERILANGR